MKKEGVPSMMLTNGHHMTPLWPFMAIGIVGLALILLVGFGSFYWHHSKAQAPMRKAIRAVGATPQVEAIGPQWLTRTDMIRDLLPKRIIGVHLAPVPGSTTVTVPEVNNEQLRSLFKTGTNNWDNCRTLTIASQNVSDEGLRCLGSLPKLEWLELNDTQLTDAGLAHIEPLTGLKFLHIRNCAVGDNGLSHLNGLVTLEQIILDGTQVTDEGLVHLAPLKQLKYISLQGTRVTSRGIDELQEQLPNVHIRRP